MNRKPELRPTKDYEKMRHLATAAGLEEGTLESIVASYGFFDGEALVACVALKRQHEVFSIECLAVEKSHRGQGLGAQLVSVVEDEARRLGASRLWALARAPGFFEKIGFVRDHSHEPWAPTTVSCESCPQYKVNCDPAVLSKMLTDALGASR